jgi:S-adenosylmethionine:diacylglycerol 3-amino-3-carboxypropyl transferase
MSAIEITRQDLSISQLRAEAARTADAKQAVRGHFGVRLRRKQFQSDSFIAQTVRGQLS